MDCRVLLLKEQREIETYDSMRVKEMFKERMAARHSSRAPTLSVIEKWMVVLIGDDAVSVHLWRWLAAADMAT